MKPRVSTTLFDFFTSSSLKIKECEKSITSQPSNLVEETSGFKRNNPNASASQNDTLKVTTASDVNHTSFKGSDVTVKNSSVIKRRRFSTRILSCDNEDSSNYDVLSGVINSTGLFKDTSLCENNKLSEIMEQELNLTGSKNRTPPGGKCNLDSSMRQHGISSITSPADQEMLAKGFKEKLISPSRTIELSSSMDVSLALLDTAGPHRQNSGLSAQDDPTPIPIPRKSHSTSDSLQFSSFGFGNNTNPSSVTPFKLTSVSPPNTNDIRTPLRSTSVKVPSTISNKESRTHDGHSDILNEDECFLPLASPSVKSPCDTTLKKTLLLNLATTSENDNCKVTEHDSFFYSDGNIKNTSVGTLFGTVSVNPRTPPCDTMVSPFFDPASVDSSTFLQQNELDKTHSVKFSCIANIFNTIEALKGSGSGSKKKVVVALTNIVRLLLWHSPTDIIPLTYFCLNKVAPVYMNVEMGIGEGLLLKIVTEVYGRSEKSVKADLMKHEDLGRVAELSRSKMRVLFRPRPLTISSVFSELRNLSDISGTTAQTKKKEKIKRMLVAAEGSEAKFIIRFLQGKMRLGVQMATIYQSLAYAFVLTIPKPDPELAFNQEYEGCSDVRRRSTNTLLGSNVEKALIEMEAAVRTAFSQASNIEFVIKNLFKGEKPDQLKDSCVVQPGIPVQPMLAKPTKGLEEIFSRFSNCEFTCEYKYDGERAQIHLKSDGDVVIFSRNLETITQKYPDVVALMKSCIKQNVQDYIVDSEIVAFNCDTERILPFQVLSTRKKKNVDNSIESKVKVCIFVFDCLYLNKESLLKKPLIERRSYLQELLIEIPNQVQFASHKEMNLLEDVDAFLQEAMESNCEGLMIKTLKDSASYEPSKRSFNWLKLKKDYLDNITDTLDLVLMGAYAGRGKRSKVFGAFLLGCYNENEDTFQTICKTGTGFSDDQLHEFYQELQEHTIAIKHTGYHVHEKMTPDVWFSPRVVWEVRAADLSISPVHTASSGVNNFLKGIGLRFPRFIRVRPDKTPEQATSANQVMEMYLNQASNKKTTNKLSKLSRDDYLSENDEIEN
ncbi:DNA ligase 1-like [Hylaeus volcanicus]|uniref:DNA ligase 1-like n=1 Tax=Hylaeus volcanicus TaxID=313075 RepID=UPI0023B7E183|nr:DNA ligase 1-like [Hylaeus volcanicus]